MKIENRLTSKPRILVIDDDPYFIKIVQNTLSEICDVIGYSRAKEGLQRASAHPLPDLILLDILMPVISGYQICRELKGSSVTFDIPVLFVSGMNKASEKVRCFELGGVDFMHKPVEMAELSARVKNHLMLKLQREMLESLAANDALTGLANKRSYQENMERELCRAIRESQPLGLIVCDIDFFKKYNDTLGHGQGDNCLQSVACTLNESVTRASDLVARIGGEEFALILPNCDRAGCESVAAKLVQKVASKAIPHPASQVAKHVTISVGAFSVVPDKDDTVQSLFELADSALYRAKASGRNRFVMSTR